MSWSDQRVLRFSGPRDAFHPPLRSRHSSATALRDEIRRRARANALENGGEAHRSRVRAAMQRKKARAEHKKWLARVERAQRLQDRENSARAYLMRRGMQRGSDFSAGERQELRKWFDILDADAGGDIDIAELAAPLLSTGIAQSLPEVRKIIEANAIEVGGGIDFESFQRMLKVKPRGNGSASDERTAGPNSGGSGGGGGGGVEATGKTFLITFWISICDMVAGPRSGSETFPFPGCSPFQYLFYDTVSLTHTNHHSDTFSFSQVFSSFWTRFLAFVDNSI